MKTIKEILKDARHEVISKESKKEHNINITRSFDKNNNLLIEEFPENYEKDTKYYIGNELYYFAKLGNIEVIYDKYKRAISITFEDNYEWIGEPTYVTKEAIRFENAFRKDYFAFVEKYRKSNMSVSLYNEANSLLEKLEGNDFVCNNNYMYDFLENVIDYLNVNLFGNIDNFCQNQYDVIKNTAQEMKEKLDSELINEEQHRQVEEYYNWTKSLEDKYSNILPSTDYFLISLQKNNRYIESIGNRDINETDKTYIEYFHSVITNYLNTREDLQDYEPDEVEIEEVPEPENNNTWALTKEEKLDYLTWKVLRKYASTNRIKASEITVKEAKDKLRELIKTEKDYNRILKNIDIESLDDVNYQVYNIIKESKNELNKTDVLNEPTSDEVLAEKMHRDYSRAEYNEKIKYLYNSKSKYDELKDVISGIREKRLNEMYENYRKVKRRITTIGIGIMAGVLSITSFGVGIAKNKLTHPKVATVTDAESNIAVFDDGNQIMTKEINEINEKALAGYGSDNSYLMESTMSTETMPEVVAESEILETEQMGEKNTDYVSELEAEILQEKEAIEKEAKELETETLVYESPSIETESEVLETESELVETESESIETETEVKPVQETVKDLSNAETELVGINQSDNVVVDKKGLLKTYKKELKNLKASLPKSDITIDNVLNIGENVIADDDATLKNDEYSLILDKNEYPAKYKDTLPRIISKIVMTDGTSGITVKEMSEVNSLIEQGYTVAGYGLINPYSKDINNLEGFFEVEDVMQLVRK